MADQLLSKVQDVLEGQIDFEGQKLVENISRYLLIASGLIAFLVGYLAENIHLTLWIGLAGTFITLLITVPPWPMYNVNPQPWLNSGRGISGIDIRVDGKKVN